MLDAVERSIPVHFFIAANNEDSYQHIFEYLIAPESRELAKRRVYWSCEFSPKVMARVRAADY